MTEILSSRPNAAPRSGIAVITPRQQGVDDDEIERDILDDLDDELAGEMTAYRLGLPIARGKQHKPARPRGQASLFQNQADRSSARPEAAYTSSQFADDSDPFGVPQLAVDALAKWPAEEGANGYVSYRRGNLPLILVCPYGDLKPSSIATRPMSSAELPYVSGLETHCVETAALVLAEQLKKRNSGYPHLITCRLHPTKLDVNQSGYKGYKQGEKGSQQAYTQFWKFFEEARGCLAQLGGGHVFVIGGHIERVVELGYNLEKELFAKTDEELEKDVEAFKKVSLRGLIGKPDIPHNTLTAILRGQFAFGSMCHDLHPTTPSEQLPQPESEHYHAGGQLIQSCISAKLGSETSLGGSSINAMQILLPPALRIEGDHNGLEEECWWSVVGLADIMVAWMQHWYIEVQPSRRPYSPMPGHSEGGL